jgi:competence protein ComEC
VAPLIAYYFNKISIVALIANIFVVPIMGAVLALGMLTAILGFFSQALAKLVAALNYALLWYFAAAVKFFGSFRFASLNVPKPVPVFIAGYYAGMFALSFKFGKWIFMGLWAVLAIYVWTVVLL